VHRCKNLGVMIQAVETCNSLISCGSRTTQTDETVVQQHSSIVTDRQPVPNKSVSAVTDRQPVPTSHSVGAVA
jgi:hypothetical protein